MESVQFIQRKPYLALMMVSPVVCGLAAWYGDQAVDLWLFGTYVVLPNAVLCKLALSVLGLLALLYRGLEVLGVALAPVTIFLHVLLSAFCLIGLTWSLHSAVPSGQALAAEALSARRGLTEYLFLLFVALQIFLVTALLVELMRPKK